VSLAVARVDEARALLGIAESRLGPVVDATFDRSRSLSSAATGTLPPGSPRERNDYRATINVSYELDLWGRLRNTAGAARAELLASESARDTVYLALAAQVARSYFALAALDARVELTRRTVLLREDALRLQKRRNENGLDLRFRAAAARGRGGGGACAAPAARARARHRGSGACGAARPLAAGDLRRRRRTCAGER
jgi:multidrug efflux system outer membrane protein